MRLSPARRHTPRVAMALTSITLSVAAMSIGTSEAQAAETLAEALASAYRHNPALLAQRRAVEAVDEGVTQARAGFRPRVVSAADAGHQHTRTNFAASAGGGSTESSTRPRGYSIEISQNVFAGFRTVNAIKQAEANVLASRENLRQTEQSVLLDAVTAYVDVLRDRAIVRLQENNVRVLTSELRATRERFEAGDVSRTDVAQAEARRAAAVSALDLARANLRTSEASFQQVVGHMPGALRQPAPPVRNIPATLPEGIRRAVEETPNVLNAAFLEQAAAHNVDQITGELLPTVDLEANYSDRYDLSETVDRTETATFTARMTLPLYQGGQVYSRIRQARRTREQRGQEIENARRIARQALIAAWSSRRAAIAQLDSDRIRVRAQRTALAGVRAEEDVGQRSILDVLDAEQELLDAQVALVTTRRDLVV
ncbi:MAG: TolC family outer membrane protein, partial [Pseudomonadota bacterium]